MRASSSIAVAALLARSAFAQCTDGLAVLAGTQEIVGQCAPSVSTDAMALCSSFLGTSTVFAIPPSKTALTTTTELATRTVTRVVFTTTTTTETEIIVSTSSTTVFATPSPGPVGRREIESNELPASSPASNTIACPTLTSLPTDSASSPAISSACNCLGVSPVVSTASSDATATSTITESKTTVSTKTITSTIVTYTKSTTTTVVAMATQTVAYDRCSVGYNTGGNGKGNRAENVQANSSQDCCQQCQQRQNCVASVYTGAMCQLLIKEAQLSGATTSDKCPLGIEDYPFGPAGGMVYPGPCGF
ncbi:hypothetical protein F4814DRAFT_427926 [Daldinia grandis]|nr:hypothetical protein F4814DRAFT_427926 [Daldinia grandis]